MVKGTLTQEQEDEIIKNLGNSSNEEDSTTNGISTSAQKSYLDNQVNGK